MTRIALAIALLASVVAAPSSGPLSGHALGPELAAAPRVVGMASWYCSPTRHSPCTSGYAAAGAYGAAGPALRAALGSHWRGRSVTLSYRGRTVRIRLIDWCRCPHGRIVDVYASAFDDLGPLSAGVLRVSAVGS